MTPPRIPSGPAIVLLLALITGGWFLQQGMAQEQNVYVQARLFEEVVDHIADRYVDSVDRDTLYEHAIDGVIERLDDPNTSLLDIEAYENFRIQTEGDYGGVGLEITERDDFITVVSPLPASPGSRAGIRAGDLIVEVEGESTRGWAVQQAVQVLRGSPGSEVDVLIERPGMDAPIEFTLTREEIQLRSVPFVSLMESGAGYIPLGLFSETSTAEVAAAADSLLSEGASSLILDLRGNPGGILDQGVGITDLFLPSGADVVETRGQDGNPNGMLRASREERYEGVPIVVLVDRGSASASEIVGGALQDHDRALILGSSTFGKGSVQSLFSLSGGNVLKLTTARWYTPQGRSIERIGEEPETAADLLESDEAQHQLAISVLGQYQLPPDTAGRPTVTSSAGRTLYGGGGIVPDLLIPMDTLTAEEQEAVTGLFEQAGRYSVGVFNFAVEYLRENEDVDTDFEITEADLAELYRQLRDEREFTVDEEVFWAAERFVRLQVETEIALQGWGEPAEFQRRLPHDLPLQRAMELLRDAQSPEELFSRAGSAIPSDAGGALSSAGGGS